MECYQSQRKHCTAIKTSVDPERKNTNLHRTCSHAWLTLRDSNNYTFTFTVLRNALRVTAVSPCVCNFLTASLAPFFNKTLFYSSLAAHLLFLLKCCTI